MKTKTKGLIALIVVFVAAIYYYVTIPAINIHSTDTWGAVLFLIVIALIVKLFFYGFRNPAKIRISDLKESKILRAGVILLLVLGAVYFIGSILSSPIVNAKKYHIYFFRKLIHIIFPNLKVIFLTQIIIFYFCTNTS